MVLAVNFAFMKINKKIIIGVLSLIVFIVPGFVFAQQDSYGSLQNCIDGGNTQDYCCTAFQYSACQSVDKCANKTCDVGYPCNPISGECAVNPSNPTPPVSNPPTTQPAAETSEGACINTGKCPTGLCEINGLCLPKPTGSVDSFVGKTTLVGLLLKIIQFLLTFAGVVAVGVLVIGGFWYITSAGNEEQAEKGQKAITNAIIGLVVVILAYTIVAIISSTLIADKFVK